MIPKFIDSASDLKTSHQDTVNGFLEQAKRKIVEANQYIDEAKEIRNKIQDIDDLKSLKTHLDENPEDLLAIATSVGFSDKSIGHLKKNELKHAVLEALNSLYGSNVQNLSEEITYRYLLTRGDSLGGKMRNLVGRVAADKFIDILFSELKERDIEYDYKLTSTNKINRIFWENKVLFFDVTPKFIGNNIDLILVESKKPILTLNRKVEKLKHDPNSFLACGELKGGIDPAGADEHWKTARSAFERIRKSFSDLKIDAPHLFFVGYAIENSMASEIFNQLKSRRLSHATNLFHDDQSKDIVKWLSRL
jgi:type II restriction enzyme